MPRLARAEHAARPTVLAELRTAFSGAADPERAVPMRAYLRDQFAFLGLPNPIRIPLEREAFADRPVPTEAELIALSTELWERPEREYQYAACHLLRRNVKRLTPSFLPTAEHLLTHRSWWDTVDDLATHVVGPIVFASRDELAPVMDAWIDSDDFWIARTAILHQNRYKDETDTERLFAYCVRRAGDTEFFLRKAIGWALREYSKTDEQAVRRFVADHDADLSGLSKREALKWLERRAARARAAADGVEG